MYPEKARLKFPDLRAASARLKSTWISSIDTDGVTSKPLSFEGVSGLCKCLRSVSDLRALRRTSDSFQLLPEVEN